MRIALLAVLTVFLMLSVSPATADDARSGSLSGSSATVFLPLPETTPSREPVPDEKATEEMLEQNLLPGHAVAQNASQSLPQTPLPPNAVHQSQYPKIVLYSVSWCPHCKAAKEYLTKNNIPFINRDVELDPDAYRTLTEKYKSNGVPLIVIGDDAEIIKGFDEQRFQRVLDKYRK